MREKIKVQKYLVSNRNRNVIHADGDDEDDYDGDNSDGGCRETFIFSVFHCFL